MKNTNREIFNNIYKHRKWIFGCGTGSIAFLNRPFIDYVNNFLKSHGDVKTIVDLGCGDLQIAKSFTLDDKLYIGCDVSSYITEINKKRYKNKNMKFLALDAVNDTIPAGDLIIIKDVLIHMCNKDVKTVLTKISGYKYIIIQNCIGNLFEENKNIRTGRNWRLLDVTKPPFNFAKIKLTKKYFEGLYAIPFWFMRAFKLPVLYNGIFVNF